MFKNVDIFIKLTIPSKLIKIIKQILFLVFRVKLHEKTNDHGLIKRIMDNVVGFDNYIVIFFVSIILFQALFCFIFFSFLNTYHVAEYY